MYVGPVLSSSILHRETEGREAEYSLQSPRKATKPGLGVIPHTLKSRPALGAWGASCSCPQDPCAGPLPGPHSLSRALSEPCKAEEPYEARCCLAAQICTLSCHPRPIRRRAGSHGFHSEKYLQASGQAHVKPLCVSNTTHACGSTSGEQRLMGLSP